MPLESPSWPGFPDLWVRHGPPREGGRRGRGGQVNKNLLFYPMDRAFLNLWVRRSLRSGEGVSGGTSTFTPLPLGRG